MLESIYCVPRLANVVCWYFPVGLPNAEQEAVEVGGVMFFHPAMP